MRGFWMTVILLAPVALHAAARFDPVKDVPATVAGGVLTLALPKGVHLKVRLFRVALASQGSLKVEDLPPSHDQDEAGDPIWRGTVRVGLKASGLEDPARLVLTYQPCTEGPDGMCFLPVKRTLSVSAAELR